MAPEEEEETPEGLVCPHARAKESPCGDLGREVAVYNLNKDSYQDPTL